MYVLLCVVPHAALLSSGMNQTEPNHHHQQETTTMNDIASFRPNLAKSFCAHDKTNSAATTTLCKPFGGQPIGTTTTTMKWPTDKNSDVIFVSHSIRKTIVYRRFAQLSDTFRNIRINSLDFQFSQKFSFSSSSSVEYCNRFSKYSSKHESSLELDIFYVDKQKRNEQGVNLTTTIGNCKFNCIFLLSKIKQTI